MIIRRARPPTRNTRRSISRLPRFRPGARRTRPFPCVWLAPRPPRPRSSVAPALRILMLASTSALVAGRPSSLSMSARLARAFSNTSLVSTPLSRVSHENLSRISPSSASAAFIAIRRDDSAASTRRTKSSAPSPSSSVAASSTESSSSDEGDARASGRATRRGDDGDEGAPWIPGTRRHTSSTSARGDDHGFESRPRPRPRPRARAAKDSPTEFDEPGAERLRRGGVSPPRVRANAKRRAWVLTRARVESNVAEQLLASFSPRES